MTFGGTEPAGKSRYVDMTRAAVFETNLHKLVARHDPSHPAPPAHAVGAERNQARAIHRGHGVAHPQL